MHKYRFILKGLNCVGCAASIEQELQKVDEFIGVTLDMFDKELLIYVKEWKYEQTIFDYVNNIVKKNEPDIELLLTTQNRGNLRFRDSLLLSIKSAETISVLIGVLIVLIALFLHDSIMQILLYVAGYLLIGRIVIVGAYKKLFSRNIFNEHFLMTTATLGALFLGEYLEAIAVMLFYQVGRYLESKIIDYSQKSVTELLSINPEYANILIDNQIVRTNPQKVKKGDFIVIKAGERVPLDCTIIEGSSEIDNSIITGESLPQAVSTGKQLLSGAINLHSVLKAVVDNDFENSTISRIIELIQSAKRKKTRTERFITRFSRVYTPVVLAMAALIATVPLFVFQDAKFSVWLYRALIFLVISCPCALVISVPLSFFSGLAVLIKGGVLVKGVIHIEDLAQTDTVFFDKTGTITAGKMMVSAIIPNDQYNEETVLKYAYYAEYHSNHPLAVAINSKYHQLLSNHQAIVLPDIVSVEEIAGKGIKVLCSEGIITVGSVRFLTDEGISVEYDNINNLAVMGVALNKTFLGVIEFSDTMRNKVSKMILQLKKKKIKLIMLTGDKEEAAAKIAKDSGIDYYYSELKPEDKLTILKEHQEASISNNKSKQGKTIFIGDGINDAPAMAYADIGIAMGGIGADVSIEAAGIVLKTDEIDKLADIISISRKTLNKAKQNIIFALGVKLVFLILGALGLITIWGAVFADVGVTLLAILNSLQLLKYRKLVE